MSKHKTVVLIIIAICMAVYGYGMHYLFDAANHAFSMDVATVVLSVPLIFMFVAFICIIMFIDE